MAKSKINLNDGPMLPANTAQLIAEGIPQRQAMSLALMREPACGKVKGLK